MLHTFGGAGCAPERVKQNTKATSYKVFPQTLRFVERLFKVCTKSPDIIKPSKRYEARSGWQYRFYVFSFFLFSPRNRAPHRVLCFSFPGKKRRLLQIVGELLVKSQIKSWKSSFDRIFTTFFVGLLLENSILRQPFFKAIPHKSAREFDERFFVRKRCKTAGILRVFQGFTNEFLAKKIRQNPQTHLCGVALSITYPSAKEASQRDLRHVRWS